MLEVVSDTRPPWRSGRPLVVRRPGKPQLLAIRELGPRPGPRRLLRVWLAGFGPEGTAYVFAFSRGRSPAEQVTVACLTGARRGKSGRGRLSRVREGAELHAVTPLIAAACNMRGQSTTQWLVRKARAQKLFVGRLEGADLPFGNRNRLSAISSQQSAD